MRLLSYVLLALAFSTRAPADVGPAASRPIPLLEVEDAARYLFGAARDARWHQADEQMDTLQHASMNLPMDLAPSDVVAAVRARVHELADTVPHRDRIKTMEAANAITQLSIGLDTPDIPAQVLRLGYLGRQLEVGVAARRPATITRATADIRQTWSEIEQQLIQRGRLSVVRQMTDIVVSLEGTKRLSDVSRLARAELDAVSRLEGGWR